MNMWNFPGEELNDDNVCSNMGLDLSDEFSIHYDTPPLFADSLIECDVDYDRSFMTSKENPVHSLKITNEFLDIKNEIEIFEEHSPRDTSSGSETSSNDQIWFNKSDLTPPTTPPSNQSAKESVQIITAADIRFLPLQTNAANVKFTVNDRSKESIPSTRKDIQKQQAERRQQRMIRNRESAHLSRKRAKEHVANLENQVQQLTSENIKLKKENQDLKERLSKYEPFSFSHHRRRFSELPKKTTALLIIAATFCLNFSSLSVLDHRRTINGGIKTSLSSNGHQTRSLLWMDSIDDGSLTNLSTSCPVAINQSESIRLERELRQWIVGGADKREPTVDSHPRKYQAKRRKRIPRAGKPRAYPMDLWGFPQSLLALEGLYEAIHRRPDTFYLVSFSADHLLLPAMARNETSRPKMSVMLPAFLANASGKADGPLEMMQIDCEVTNTQFLSVQGNDIPSHLRQQPKFNNISVKAESDSTTTSQENPDPSFINIKHREKYSVNSSMSNRYLNNITNNDDRQSHNILIDPLDNFQHLHFSNDSEKSVKNTVDNSTYSHSYNSLHFPIIKDFNQDEKSNLQKRAPFDILNANLLRNQSWPEN